MADDLFSSPRWSRRTIAVVLYPFAAAAVAINVFLASLLMQAVGLTAISPIWALWISVPLGIPATILFTLWVERLLNEAAD